ncbi:MAG: pyroglutamyl-peptidase I [Verrucomicrobiota bacterium]|nr:pyroglutamyl-peptidase I [Verrucomicrobiota bacterium]
MAVIVLTGYGLWGNRTINPSWEMLRETEFALPSGWEVRLVQLPVSWATVWDTLAPELTAEVKAVVCFGLSEGIRAIALEGIAKNRVNSREVDALGKLFPSDFACAIGPACYPTRLPVKALHTALAAEGIPSKDSDDAGDYLCNYIFYEIMYWIANTRPDVIGGFVHVPPIANPTLPGNTGLPLPTLRRAAQVIAGTVADAARY